jgi:hypothetical protein
MEVEPYLPFRGKKGFGGSFTSLDSDEGPKVNQNTKQFSDACAAMERPSPAYENRRSRRFEEGEMRTGRRLANQRWEAIQ